MLRNILDVLSTKTAELGETWFFGTKPILIRFYSPKYKPQLGPPPVNGEELPDEAGWIEIGKEWVSSAALEMLDIRQSGSANGGYKLDPRLTEHEIENLLATSFLIRENNLRKQCRSLSKTSRQSNERPLDNSDVNPAKIRVVSATPPPAPPTMPPMAVEGNISGDARSPIFDEDNLLFLLGEKFGQQPCESCLS